MSTRIPLHVVEFAAQTNTTDLINAFVDYYNQYKSEILKKPASCSTLTTLLYNKDRHRVHH